MDWEPIADAMECLAVSLEERNAIPEVRLRAFNDPRYAEIGHKSVIFRLGLDIGLTPEESRGLRKAALSVRK